MYIRLFLLSIISVASLRLGALPAHAAITVVQPDAKPNATFSTQTFFEYGASEFPARRGYLVLLDLKYNNKTSVCWAAPPKPDWLPTPEDAGHAAGQLEIFITVKWFDSRVCGLQTFSQLWALVETWRKALPQKSAPARTLVILLNKKYPGVPGNPNVEAYAAHTAGIPDGVPPADIDVLMMPNDQRKELMAHAAKTHANPEAMLFEVTYERGAWNDLFVSWWYQTIVWLIFAINVLAILYSIYSVADTVRDGKFHANLRTFIFCSAFFGFTLYTTSIPMRNSTYINKIVESVSTWIISMAFHLLLYLWSVFLMQVQRSKAILVFRGLIGFGASVATFAFIVSQLRNNLEVNETTRTLSDVTGYLLPVTQGVIGAAFLYYAANFFLRGKEAGKISPDTVAALTRLAQVAVIAFVGYFAVAITNLNFIVELNTKPGVTAALTVIRLMSASVRGLAILLVMGARAAPQTRTSRNNSTFTASSITSSSSTLVGSRLGSIVGLGGAKKSTA